MKFFYLIWIAISLSFSASALGADDGAALFKQHSCTVCHSISKEVVGPSLNEVAAKYRGDPGAQAMLEKKIRHGGSGVWGSMPMPPTAKSVSDADVNTIVKWVLSLK